MTDVEDNTTEEGPTISEQDEKRLIKAYYKDGMSFGHDH